MAWQLAVLLWGGGHSIQAAIHHPLNPFYRIPSSSEYDVGLRMALHSSAGGLILPLNNPIDNPIEDPATPNNHVPQHHHMHHPLNTLPPTVSPTSAIELSHVNHAGMYLQLTEQQLASAINARLCLGLDDIFIALFLILLILLTIFGNILVVLSVCLYKRMRTFTNILLTSLATADLLVGLVVMPLALVDLLYSHHWPFGRLLCSIWATTDVLLCTASILNLCVISLDRYMAITSPLKYPRTRSRLMAAVLLSSVWLISLIVCSPPLFVPSWGIFTQEANSKSSNNDFVCVYSPSIPYRIYSASGSFYIPLMIMLSVYFKIFKVASEREKLMRQTLGTCRLSRRLDKTRRRQNLLQCQNHNRCASAPTARAREMQVLNTNDTPPQNHKNSVYYSEGGMEPSVNNEKRPSLLTTEANEELSDVESPVHLIINNNSNHNDNSKQLSTVESKSLVNLTNDDKKEVVPKRKMTETTETDSIRRPSILTMHTGDKLQPSALVAKAKQHYHKNGPGKAIRGSKEKIVYMRERKALKTIGIVVLGFIICWLPFFVLYLIEVFFTKFSNTYSFQLLSETFLWLGYSNSCLNPIVYTLYSGDFRRCFRDLLGFGCVQHHRRTMSVKKLHQQSTVF